MPLDSSFVWQNEKLLLIKLNRCSLYSMPAGQRLILLIIKESEHLSWSRDDRETIFPRSAYQIPTTHHLFVQWGLKWNENQLYTVMDLRYPVSAIICDRADCKGGSRRFWRWFQVVGELNGNILSPGSNMVSMSYSAFIVSYCHKMLGVGICFLIPSHQDETG